MIQTVRNLFESIVIVLFINEHEWVKFISKTEQEEQSFLNISPRNILFYERNSSIYRSLFFQERTSSVVFTLHVISISQFG